MKIAGIILCIVVVLTSLSCKDGLLLADRMYMLTIENNSNEKICYYKALSGSQHQYPDTALPTSKPEVQYVNSNNKYYDASRKKWEDLINDMPADTMSMYIFDANVFDNTDWNTIRDSYMVLKRYNIRVEYLKNNNNNIVYP